MRRFLPLVLLLAALLLDTSILPVLIDHWAMPMLLLDSVIVLGLLLGRTRGLMYGTIAGVMLDVSVGSHFGMYFLLYTAFGYLAGIAGRKFQRYLLTTALTPLIILSLFEIIMAVNQIIIGIDPTGAMFIEMAVRIVIQTVLTQFMYLLYNRLLKPKWSRYAAR